VASLFTQNLVERIAAIQRQIDSASWRAAGETVVGRAEGDAVRVRIRDDGRVTAVEIEPSTVDPGHVERLERLVGSAVQDASDRLCELRTARITAAIRAMTDDLFAPVTGEGS
jgi:DNA-binding protein YbaB